jgi:spore coat polysaccharide biosynthesis protein SpsF
MGGCIAGVLQARTASTRLPGKVLIRLLDRTLLEHVIERAKRIPSLDRIVVATTRAPRDDPIVRISESTGVNVFRGDEDDVLGRFIQAASSAGATTILRITTDNPLFCPDIAQEIVSEHLRGGWDYTSMENLPLGVTTEVVSKDALTLLDALLKKEDPHREHVTSFIRKNRDSFKVKILPAPPDLRRPSLRLTVDTPEDFELIERIYQSLYTPGEIIPIMDVIRLLEARPELGKINIHIKQKGI